MLRGVQLHAIRPPTQKGYQHCCQTVKQLLQAITQTLKTATIVLLFIYNGYTDRTVQKSKLFTETGIHN